MSQKLSVIGALPFQRINTQRWQNSNSDSNVSNIHEDPRESDQLRVHLLKVARYRGVLSALSDGLTRPCYKCAHTNTPASPVWVVNTQRKQRPHIFTSLRVIRRFTQLLRLPRPFILLHPPPLSRPPSAAANPAANNDVTLRRRL